MPVRERTTETKFWPGPALYLGWNLNAMRVPLALYGEIRNRSHMDLRAAYPKVF